tara:strand:- start:83 stop:262 length:180 start_codon:yes stop_codon:yes gene_type:complete
MFDWIFASNDKPKEPTYPNLHNMVVDLQSRVEMLEEQNKELHSMISKIQPVVYNITNKD